MVTVGAGVDPGLVRLEPAIAREPETTDDPAAVREHQAGPVGFPGGAAMAKVLQGSALPSSAVIADLCAAGGNNRAIADLIAQGEKPARQVTKVTVYVDQNRAELEYVDQNRAKPELAGKGTVRVALHHNGKPREGRYEFKPGAKPEIDGTSSPNGNVVEWTFPEDAKYTMASSYTVLVVANTAVPAGTPVVPLTRSGPDPQPPPAATSRLAFVYEDRLNLRVAADQESPSLARLPFGQRVYLLDESAKAGWRRVAVLDQTGYVAANLLRVPPAELAQDLGLSLVKVKPNQTFWGLVKEVYGIAGTEGTPDLTVNHFINAIRKANKEEAFEVKTNVLDDVGNAAVPGRDASDTYLRAGVNLWIPSLGVAAAMNVGSGTVTGEVSRLVELVRRKLEDFAAACKAAGPHLRPAIQRHARELSEQLLKGLIDLAIDAAAILATSTAIGALAGSLVGGVGAIPGAEIGFEFGLLVLEYYGLYLLIEMILTIAGNLLSRLGDFVSIAWNANGNPDQIDLAGRTLADALGILMEAVLLALIHQVAKAGGKAFSETRFAKKIGETALFQWLKERARNASGQPVEEPPRGGDDGLEIEGTGYRRDSRPSTLPDLSTDEIRAALPNLSPLFGDKGLHIADSRPDLGPGVRFALREVRQVGIQFRVVVGEVPKGSVSTLRRLDAAQPTYEITLSPRLAPENVARALAEQAVGVYRGLPGDPVKAAEARLLGQLDALSLDRARAPDGAERAGIEREFRAVAEQLGLLAKGGGADTPGAAGARAERWGELSDSVRGTLEKLLAGPDGEMAKAPVFLPSVELFRDLYNALDSVTYYLSELAPKEVQLKFAKEKLEQIRDYRKEAMKVFKDDIYRRAFKSKSAERPLTPKAYSEAQAMIENLTAETSRMLGDVHGWMRDNNIDFDTALEKGEARWGTRLKEAQKIIGDIVKKYKYHDKPVGYVGSVTDGRRGPHKAGTNLDLHSFDIDLYPTWSAAARSSPTPT